MKKFKNFLLKKQVEGMNYIEEKKEEMKEIIQNEDGGGFVSFIIEHIIEIVVGALILGVLFYMFKDEILPKLQQTLSNMFNPPAKP